MTGGLLPLEPTLLLRTSSKMSPAPPRLDRGQGGMTGEPMIDDHRPDFSEIDVWGLTHPGRVRTENQDHYFIGSVARGVTIDSTSVEDEHRRVMYPERLATLAMVADGVGGRHGGEEAARLAVKDLIQSVAKFYHEAEFREDQDPEIFSRLLLDAAHHCHESLLHKAEQVGGGRKFSTTLTLFLGLWPHAYLLQVGDSRAYMYMNGELTQISKDQTWAQDLVDSGTLTQTQGVRSKWSNVLSSAMGGESAAPVVTRITRDWGAIMLFCTDGLTKHVPDELIKERLSNMRSARDTAELLLADALADGGTDNITIILGRSVRSDE